LGGFSFYQRSEVKDAVAYVRLALFPDDDIALLRVLNTPPRGIGKVTVEALQKQARERNSSLWAAIGEMVERGDGRGVVPLRSFRQLIEDLRAKRAELPPDQFMAAVLSLSGYLEMLQQRDDPDDTARTENLNELVNAMAESAERGETLADFLDRTALVSDSDNFDERAPVTLLTVHTAKGLEFDHVFLTGLEEGVFPHNRSLHEAEELEEERRLCYVGMTRTRETLTLTRAVYRRMYGSERLQASEPSRFLQEIPGELIDTAKGSLAAAGETRRYEPDYEHDPEAFLRHTARRRFSPPQATRRTTRPAMAPRVSRPVRMHRSGSADPLLGQRVRHPTYGAGTIIDVEGQDEDRKLTVSFENYGTKKLVERFANLSWA
jgi:DNA helicase-2/ATP-dependent DNA helicase PcrA